MTIKTPEKKILVGAILPWLVALCALVFYLTTLNRWVSVSNVDQVASTTGLSEMPQLNSPVYYLATYPFHWLPARLVPFGLNLFSAVCAALSLALLARSVALLPHDRTHDQRLREEGEFSMLSIPGSWVPPVLATLVLGLQLTIWENATNGAKEMLDLLLFAYVIRCVLEYRTNEQDSWLFRAALVYGVGMTDNWVMIGLLPAFVFALVWIRGVSFFNARFLTIFLVCGIGGLLLYFIPPAVFIHSEYAQLNFWQALKFYIKSQKDPLWIILHNLPANLLLMMALTSLLPVLLIGIKWASHFGDPSPMGTALTTGVFHLAHAAFFGICLWAAFDPGFALRPKFLSVPVLLLLFGYLGALSVGYFAGYFLLVFRPLRDRQRRPATLQNWLHRSAQVLLFALLVLIPCGLLFKNYARINMVNGKAFSNFAGQLTENIPTNAVVLSDDPNRLLLAQIWTGNIKNQDRIFLNTRMLSLPKYFNKLQSLRPLEWLPPVDEKNPQVVAHGVEIGTLIQLLRKFSETRPLYYLHPSFGFYFEVFYPVPHGLVFELKSYDTNSVSPPALTESQIAENESFWAGSVGAVDEIKPLISEQKSKNKVVWEEFCKKFLLKLHIPYEPALIAQVLGNYYSHGLNYWGVQMQDLGNFQQASNHFERAVALDPSNVSAKRNQEYNKDLLAGIPPSVQHLKLVTDDFGRYWDGQQVLQSYGPFDEPTHRFAQALIFIQGGLTRESLQQFEHVARQVPDNLQARLYMARMYASQFPEKTLAMVSNLQSLADTAADVNIAKYDIPAIEATALFFAGKPEQAEQLLRGQMEKNPSDINLLSRVAQISANFKSYTNAMIALDHILTAKPDNVDMLINKGYLAIQMGDFQTAIPALSAALTIDTNNATAKFDRAIACLSSGRLDEARRDYEDLEKLSPNAFQVYFGLGEIAWRKNDTNSAIRNYDLYLANVNAASAESNTIRERYETLRAATAPPSPQPDAK